MNVHVILLFQTNKPHDDDDDIRRKVSIKAIFFESLLFVAMIMVAFGNKFQT